MIEYWFELRKRLIACVGAYVVFFVVYFICYDAVYEWITSPIVTRQYGMLVSQDIIGPLVMPVQLSASLSLLSIIPIVIYHLLSFVKPALYPKEKYITEVSVGIAVILFYVGCAISFFIVQPTVLSFVASWMPKGILFLPTIDSYLGFSIDMAIAFGVAFEIPVIIMLLIVFNLVSVEWVKAKRCWWVVGLFFLAMVLTPPDVYSQIALAVPMWVLVEFVLLLGSYLKKDISD